MKKQAEDLGLGATGQFPAGKIDPADAGEIKIAISPQRGRVAINLGTPVVWLMMTPEQARRLAAMIEDASFRAEVSLRN